MCDYQRDRLYKTPSSATAGWTPQEAALVFVLSQRDHTNIIPNIREAAVWDRRVGHLTLLRTSDPAYC